LRNGRAIRARLAAEDPDIQAPQVNLAYVLERMALVQSSLADLPTQSPTTAGCRIRRRLADAAPTMRYSSVNWHKPVVPDVGDYTKPAKGRSRSSIAQRFRHREKYAAPIRTTCPANGFDQDTLLAGPFYLSERGNRAERKRLSAVLKAGKES